MSARNATELLTRLLPHLTPDLLEPARRRALAPGAHPTTGHCAVATEALYHALGGRGSGYTPMSIQHEGTTHWYLRAPDGRYLDPTAAQFRTAVPYAHGRGRGFPTPRQGAMTPPPSRRAATVLRRAGLAPAGGMVGLGAPPRRRAAAGVRVLGVAQARADIEVPMSLAFGFLSMLTVRHGPRPTVDRRPRVPPGTPLYDVYTQNLLTGYASPVDHSVTDYDAAEYVTTHTKPRQIVLVVPSGAPEPARHTRPALPAAVARLFA